MSLTQHPHQHLQAAKPRIMPRHSSVQFHLPLVLALLVIVDLSAGPESAALQQGVVLLLQCTPTSPTR